MKRKKALSKTDSMDRQGEFENRFVAVILFLTFFIFTFLGAGNFIIVTFTGLLLCMVGIMQGPVRTDIWILIPLTLYNVISFASSYMTYGNTLEGYASTQLTFPVIYLLVSYLNNKERTKLRILCSFWVGVMALIGILQFAAAGFHGGMGRLSGIMGNPNAMGAMLVLGWFSAQSCLDETFQGGGILRDCLYGVKHIILAALALTLSLGALGSLCVGFISMCIYGRKSCGEFLAQSADMIFALGSGIMLYAASNYTYWPLLSVAICIYILFSAITAEAMAEFLRNQKYLKLAIFALGFLGALLVLILRPNAFATFAERIAMIRNGLSYIRFSNSLGIGPYQWRMLNLYDDDMYFNTWHIHNIFVHVGVELGLAALSMLVIAAIRHTQKKEDCGQRGEFAAAVTHNLMDTSFFYMATVPFLIMTSAKDENKTRLLGNAVVKGLFGAFGLMFLWNLSLCFK